MAIPARTIAIPDSEEPIPTSGGATAGGERAAGGGARVERAGDPRDLRWGSGSREAEPAATEPGTAIARVGARGPETRTAKARTRERAARIGDSAARLALLDGLPLRTLRTAEPGENWTTVTLGPQLIKARAALSRPIRKTLDVVSARAKRCRHRLRWKAERADERDFFYGTLAPRRGGSNDPDPTLITAEQVRVREFRGGESVAGSAGH